MIFSSARSAARVTLGVAGLGVCLGIGMALPLTGQDAPTMAKDAPPSVTVSCQSPQKVPETDRLCALFREVVATQYPDLPQTEGPAGTGRQIILEVQAAGPTGLTARLHHQTPNNRRISGPVRSYDVIDRTADDRLYAGFLSELLEANPIPF